MVFSRLNHQVFGGPAGHGVSGDQTHIIFRAPQTGEVVQLAVGRNGLGATTIDTTNYFKLIAYDGGAKGTGTAVIASRGGKSTSWTAQQAYNILTEGASPYKLDKGDYLTLKHDETGTVVTTPFVLGSFIIGLQDAP